MEVVNTPPLFFSKKIHIFAKKIKFMFKVIIVGGENRGDYKLFVSKCAFFLKNKVKEGIVILSTGDKYVDILSKTANIDVKKYFVNWNIYGKDALKKRAVEMVKECDAIILFEDGTKDTNMFKIIGNEMKKPIRVVNL